uniref:Uncharacterized protein n=1 Tax=Physcomitrium patens TaxID=3218 RepID=A0A2K1L1E0_PHYPA|nr:hypothetical protein PHYPA_002635 [Physcomitrium patens]
MENGNDARGEGGRGGEGGGADLTSAAMAWGLARRRTQKGTNYLQTSNKMPARLPPRPPFIFAQSLFPLLCSSGSGIAATGKIESPAERNLSAAWRRACECATWW